MQASAQDGAEHGLRFAELACARVLHDLSGVMGTLSGTIELLALESATSEAAQLAGDATAMLTLRLRLLRAAWAGDGEARDAESMLELIGGLSTGPRTRVDLAGLAPGSLPGPVARVALCLLLAGIDALSGSGAVSLSGSSTQLEVRIQGPRAAWPGWLAAGSKVPVPLPDSSRGLAAPMLVLAARTAGFGLQFGPGAGGVDTLLALRS